MDAFTSATTDYNSATWYTLCVNLAVMEINGPYVVNWTILLPSATPSYCSDGAVELDQSGSVAATPGRQYFAEGLVELSVDWLYSDYFPDCGYYCNYGYWYDAKSFGSVSTNPDPSDPNAGSICYTYPNPMSAGPVYSQILAMNGSGASAWAPPVIYSINPNQWAVGGTTTFTITGVGFGYSPDLTITGNGITGYTNPCASNPSSSCDGTIVATVTIDPSTPDQSVETITVTANGQNPSGFVAVPIDQQGQAAAQAVALRMIALKPYIVRGSGGGACVANDISGSVQSDQIGQKITFTVCLPAGVSITNVSSMSWTPTTPPGSAVGGYTTINSGTTSSGTAVPLSSPSCTTARVYCSFPAFYWVDQANGKQFTFQYTLTDGSSNQVTVTFNIGGPTGVNVTATPSPVGVNVIYPPYNPGLKLDNLPLLIFGGVGVNGMTFSASATNLASGSYLWVQLIQHNRSAFLSSVGKYGPTDAIVGQPGLDQAYPYGYLQNGSPTAAVYTTAVANDTAEDSPNIYLIPNYGEEERWFQATMYLMWVPAADPNCNDGAACTIPVPQVQVEWSFAGDAINTLQPGVNQGVWYVQWVLNPSNCSGGNPLSYQPNTAHPQGTAAINPK